MKLIRNTKINCTRRPHTCARCKMVIPKGSSAQHKTYRLDGKPYDEHYHLTCKKVN